MCLDLLENLIDLYGDITAVDLKANNPKMIEPIDSRLPANKHFNQVEDCIQYVDDRKTLYTAKKLLQKSYNTVLESDPCVNSCKEWRKKNTVNQIWINFKKFFVKEYHDLKLTQKISAVQTGYHSVNNVVIMEDIEYALNNLAMAPAETQGHVDQLMATANQLM